MSAGYPAKVDVKPSGSFYTHSGPLQRLQLHVCLQGFAGCFRFYPLRDWPGVAGSG